MANKCKDCRFVQIVLIPYRNNNHGVVCRAKGWLITNPTYNIDNADHLETPDWCPIQKQSDGKADLIDEIAIILGDQMLAKEAADQSL